MSTKYWYHSIPPRVRESIDRRWYAYVARLDRQGDVLLMNHGYASLDGDAEPVSFAVQDEQNRYPLQLYHHLASAIEWDPGVRALEVGSGRGGGASYIKRRFEPSLLVGMDIVSESVGFCCRYHGLDGLTFAQSDAHLLPFSDGAFDVVVNVESSGHYADGERFLGEVVRVLRPGGHFLYADVRYWEDLEAWHGQIAGTGLHVVREQNITPNVVHALALDGARRQRLINRIAPRPFHKVFKKFAGVGDSAFLQVSPEPGKRVYMSYVLRKECG